MSFIQVVQFNPKHMGRRKGWCLQNCDKGFGITKPTYPSAKADMEAQLKNGTLHGIETLPLNCAVPVYLDTTSRYEHVIVCDHGTWYEDGRVIKPYTRNIYGWGEFCDGTRVVKWVEEYTPSFLPAKGYWCYGDKDARIAKLAAFMYKEFPAYTSYKALGNFYGNNIKSSIKEFQRRTGLVADGCVGKKTYAMLKKYGFKG